MGSFLSPLIHMYVYIVKSVSFLLMQLKKERDTLIGSRPQSFELIRVSSTLNVLPPFTVQNVMFSLQYALCFFIS